MNNAGVVVGSDRTLLIDTTATIDRTRAMRAELHAAGIGDPRYIVNTHFHGDHTFGNCVFDTAEVIGTSTTAREAGDAGLALCGLWPAVDWGEITLVAPSILVEDRLGMDLGGVEVELFDVGPAHTSSDLVVWVPRERVLFTGDVAWNGVTPFALMGSVDGSLAALQRLLELDPAVVVPGHGDVGGLEVLEQTRRYLLWCRDLAFEGRREGMSPLQVAQRAWSEGTVPELSEAERLVANLFRVYAELDGVPTGGRIDIREPFSQMSVLSGAPPLSHA
ncbi:MBL fold metallo-hydrolase [Nocardia alba]|uniref:MBL fold metallo-hydrolase n=1 Tax=Nocardia alba TaxID=225051 RepID=UPI001A9D2B97|nr:MBL fold metallo-hydrolase [Nocardia alba]